MDTAIELMRAAGQEFYNMLPEGHAEFPGQLMLYQLWGNPFFALVKTGAVWIVILEVTPFSSTLAVVNRAVKQLEQPGYRVSIA